MSNYNVVAGCDIGNGYTKALYKFEDKHFSEGIVIDIPSVSCTYNNVRVMDVEDIPDNENVFDNLADNRLALTMDGTIYHKSVFTIGKNAAKRENAAEFDINEIETAKYQENLSQILLVSTLAGAALEVDYKRNRKLPAEINLNVWAAVALPIADFIKSNREYRQSLEGHTFRTVIKNFSEDVVVNVTFVNVSVSAEGDAACTAVMEDKTNLLSDVADYLEQDDLYSAEEIEKIRKANGSLDNFIGIDIGDGTVNIPIFEDGQMDMRSESMSIGIGTVFEAALEDMKNINRQTFSSRKDIANYIVNHLDDGEDNRTLVKVLDAIHQAAPEALLNELTEEFAKIYYKYSRDSKIVFLFGGGSCLVWEQLLPMLREATKDEMSESVPIVYMPSNVSRTLNRDGLFIKAGKRYKNRKKDQ